MVMAVVILMVALSGCTTSSPPVVSVATTPVETYTPEPTAAVTVLLTTAPVPTQDTAAIADKGFVDAIDACYAANPVISDVASRLAFTSCVQKTPDPKGVCAWNYKDNILKYTKDDDTTAGYSRVNTRIQLARNAYNKGLSYNYLIDKNEACSQPTMGRPI